MGANQSSKTLHLRQAAQLTAELEQRQRQRQRQQNNNKNKSGGGSKKDSFSRQQLNRLMGRRSTTTTTITPGRAEQQVAGESGHLFNCNEPNQEHEDDEWQSPTRRLTNKSISERATNDSFALLNNNNNATPYFVTPTQQQQRARQLDHKDDDGWTLPSNGGVDGGFSVNKRQQDKFIMTPRGAAKQPLDSSAARQPHPTYQQQQVVGVTPQQQQQEQQVAGGNERPLSRPSRVHQLKQQQQQQALGLKSSCSPSSASSSSALSNSSSSQHSSSSESFKLLASGAGGGGKQEQLMRKRSETNEPSSLGATATQSANGKQKPNTTTTATATISGNNNGNNYAIKQAHKTLVAMPQHRRVASSGGQAMSWSKQQQQQQMMMLANGGLQGNQQQQQLDSLEHPTYQVFDQRQQQQAQYLSSHPPYAISAAESEAQQQYYATQYLTNHQQHPAAEFGYASAPLQRRHNKWLNSQQQQQQQYQCSAQQQQPLYNQTNLDFHYVDPHEQYLQHLHQYNLLHHYQQQAEVLTFQSPPSATSRTLEKARSKSLSKSAVLGAGKNRSRNPLAAIFPFASPASNQQELHQTYTGNGKAKSPRSKKHLPFGSNTIHLSSSKSHQNLMLRTPNGKSSSSAANSNNNNNNFNLSSSSSLKRVKSSPLSPQQTTYEAMRTIDMYLIRQIARSCMDFEMEQKIDLEIRLRELASQSMLEARNEIDVLEVEKSLLASDQRMNCYAQQLEQQRKRLSATPSLGGTNSVDSGRGSKASAGGGGGRRAQRSDVIGCEQEDTGSPAGYSSLLSSSRTTSTSKTPAGGSSSQSSPSKLSPVSGESANSPPVESQVAATASNQDDASTMSRSRRKSNNAAAMRQANGRGSIASGGGGGGGNTLNRLQQRRTSQSHKSQKQRQRERLDQHITAQSNINCLNATRNVASLTVSDLRVPLMWRDVDHFKGRGDYRRYAVFCLLKIGSQIYDTRLISDVDRQMTDLTFEDDVIVFNQVEHDFELELEVYSCVYLEQFSLSSTPRKLKEKLSNSVSRAMGRRLGSHATASVNFMKELEAYDKSYRFAMIASAKLGLMDASETTKTYDLHLVSPEAHGRHTNSNLTQPQAAPYSATTLQRNISMTSAMPGLSQAATGTVTTGNQKDLQRNTLPLFGHFCCQLQVRPDVFDKHVKSGYLRVATINLPGDPRDGTRGSNNNRSQKDEDLNANNTDSMLRSALAASSKLATISMSSSTIHWAMLRNFTLNLWQVDEQKIQQALRRGHAPQVDISRKQPVRVTIDKYARLLRVSNSSLTLETDKGCFVLAVYNPATPTNKATGDELGQWLRSIEQMIYDSHIWGSVLNHYPPPRG